jgi:ankyrin repeat protein
MKRSVIAIAAASCLAATAAAADPALDGQLCTAGQAGAADQMRQLLQEGADANAACASKAGDDHFGPLYLAMKADTLDGVTALLDAGAKVGAQETKYGLSAVFQIRSAAVGELLFRRGADINARNARGQTPFQYLTDRIGGTFTEDKAIPVGALLLAHGADVSAPANDMSPLMEATIAQETGYMAFLLDHGANAAWRDKSGDSALGVAIRLQGVVRAEFTGGYHDAEALLRARGAPP